jgi:transposase
MIEGMKTPLFIRPLTDDERRQIQAGFRSKDAFVLRRAQVLFASSRGERATAIAKQVGCHRQTVLNIIHGFNTAGLAVLEEGSSRPHQLRTTFPDETLEALRDLLHRSPRDFGLDTGIWTLSSAAQISFQLGLTPRLVSGESVRRALKRLGKNWKRAKHWITSPDSQYLQKKNARDRLMAWASTQPGWAIGFLDEVWWSRFALPSLNAWQSKDEPVRLVEQVWRKNDPDPKAFACYGVLWQQGPVTDPLRRQMSLRFVDGRPVSAITTTFLEWICTKLQEQGKRSWLLIWDNASWHYSKLVRTWIREHNQKVKQEHRGVRILPFFLPTKSPWLNPIEPKWVHAKKAVVEPNGLLTAKQLAERICAHFGCSYEPHLALVEKVS